MRPGEVGNTGCRLGSRLEICAEPQGLRRLLAAAAIFSLVACAHYDPAPLPRRADLAADLAGLVRTIPNDPAGREREIDITRPLTMDDIGLLAMLNDPSLKSATGELGIARAGVVQAMLLPNPTAGFAYGALITGPGTAPAVGGSLAQDIAALVTRGARIEGARANLAAVDSALLWREWQVAQKARQLALDIASADRAISLTKEQSGLLVRELVAVRSAVAAGNLSLAAVAPLAAAAAASQQSLTALRLGRMQDWQALDALLGLVPSVRFAVARPVLQPWPRQLDALVESLPERRPDLAALRLGYRSAEADLRAAILGEFPPFSLGSTYGSDTTGVVSAGPSLTLALPIFDRNQARIGAARATRRLLREQYQARLDSAVADVRGLLQQQQQLEADLGQARQAAAEATALAAAARRAYAAGNLDERSLTDYETTALDRALNVVAIERRLDEGHIVVAVELGLGLPASRIALGRARS